MVSRENFKDIFLTGEIDRFRWKELIYGSLVRNYEKGRFPFVLHYLGTDERTLGETFTLSCKGPESTRVNGAQSPY
jgi:hypothetical protein